MFWHFVLPILDGPVYLSRVLVVKGKIAEAHRIEHDPHTPNISLQRVIRLATQHLRRRIGRTPTRRRQHRPRSVQVTQAEVDELEVVPVVEQDVLGFDVAVDHPELV